MLRVIRDTTAYYNSSHALRQHRTACARERRLCETVTGQLATAEAAWWRSAMDERQAEDSKPHMPVLCITTSPRTLKNTPSNSHFL